MRRVLLTFVALLVLISSTTAFAADEKPAEGAEKKGKGRRHHRRHRRHGHHVHGEASGPFADVPKGHWAYDAVQKSAEAGILQGWNNRFHGHKVVNRYQMAVVVARMLDRVGVLRANGKVITAQDIANLESLVIEFADELALLNVKVSTLEDTVAGLKKDVDLIKADLRGVGARAGITGTMEFRHVFTDDNATGYRFGNFVGPVGGAFIGGNNGPTAGQPFVPPSSATNGITRYHGQAASGSGSPAFNAGNTGTSGPGLVGPFGFDERQFFTVSTFALNIDREFDPHIHFHAQININAEGSRDSAGDGFGPAEALSRANLFPGGTNNAVLAGTPLAGRGTSFAASNANLMVNELYVVMDDWFTDGVNARAGIWAVPMNTEVNGPSRTYLWTVTPSIANAKWESIRPVGVDIFQHNDKDSWVFYVGFFTPGDTSNGFLRSGTLLSQNQFIGTANQFTNPQGLVVAGVPIGLAGPIAPGTVIGQGDTLGGRFPTPLSDPAMGDGPRGVDGQNLSSDDIGFYGMVGQHPTCKDHRGFSWHIAYFDRNGNIRRGLDGAPSLTDWDAWQAFISYQWSDVLLMAQYYDSSSRNYSFADLGLSAAGIIDARRIASTPFANLTGQSTDSNSFMALLNWQFARRGSFTVRFEDASDRTGVARIEAEVWTLGFNWRSSDHGWWQLEYISPQTRTRSENNVGNVLDINDDLFQINYKLNF